MNVYKVTNVHIRKTCDSAAYLEPSRTSTTIKFFCENSLQLLTVNYFL